LCSPCGHSRCCLRCVPVHRASTFLPCLPSVRLCSPHFSRRLSRSGTMRALTPAAPRTQRDRPLRSIRPAFWTSNPQPRRAPKRHVPITSCVRSAPCRARLRELLGCSPLHSAESGSCSYRLSIRLQLLPTPPRGDANKTAPRTTQLLSATYAVTSHGTDSHHTDDELTDALGARHCLALLQHARGGSNYPP
jgi:hypothetical protein